MDVGCGSGYNAVTLAMLGWQVSACEITPEILEHARTAIAGYGYDLDLRLGENEHLPFPDEAFDLLISMGVIHYCPSAEAVGRSVAEYARVLKPGGLLILLTNHPDNWTVADGTRLDGDRVRVRCPVCVLAVAVCAVAVPTAVLPATAINKAIATWLNWMVIACLQGIRRDPA